MSENPIDDLTYDWIAVMHAKAQGLNAYDKYIQDARAAGSDECVSLLEELKAQDEDAMLKVRDHVAEYFASFSSEATEEANADRESRRVG